MENVFEILKDLPKPGDYVLLTVAKGSAAGEKAILAVKEIVKNCKEIAEYYKVYKKVFI